jgi:iron complex transport system substrate-binding protein
VRLRLHGLTSLLDSRGEEYMRRALTALIGAAMVATACTAGTPTPATDPPAVPTTAPADTTSTVPEASATTQPAPATTEPAPADGFPVTITADNGDVTIEDRPERIISLSSASTEILFDIGAGDQVAVADSFSDYPPEAPFDPELSAFDPNVEALVDEYDPDLVVMFFDPGEVEASFEVLGVPVIVQFSPPDIAGIYPQMEVLGAATGNAAGASDSVARMQARIEAAVAAAGDAGAGVSYYHELGEDLFSVTSMTFVGDVYNLFGMENIADPADEDGAAFGFPQLSAEFILDADPDLIFLADTVCCGQSAETVAERPGWDVLSAVPDAVVELDDDIASLAGPRIAEFVEVISETLTG